MNLLALTEKYLGSCKEVKDFICVALGTGVGGAIVVDGRLVHGTWGGAGELGHMSVDFKGPICVCGGKGCLEHYASGTSIARRMQEKLILNKLPLGSGYCYWWWSS
ncbi:ROK family protein [Paenibacillus sp.]|uniref:ROK family protein n=1 Tax=Paenibacillus sp. TaxID=58172 RepID=UPI0028AEEA3A|nr:ROK family protein [Paenibacillus sp.]